MIEELHNLQVEAMQSLSSGWEPASDTALAVVLVAERIRDLTDALTSNEFIENLSDAIAENIAERLSPALHSAASNVGQ